MGNRVKVIQTRGTGSAATRSVWGHRHHWCLREDTEKAASPEKSILMELWKDDLEVIHQVPVAETTENRSLDRAGPTRFS